MLLLAAGLPAYQDMTARSGIGFRHDKSGTPNKYLIESVGGGVAMLDYDNDGLLDLYFVNGARLLPNMKAGQPADKTDPRFWNRLYRNVGGFRFEDVTEKAGLRGESYGMGAAAADYDGDGDMDLYVTGIGGNQLYRNRGDGTFEDVTRKAGARGSGWSSSAGWIDYDGDGRQDLIVLRYVQWDYEPDIWCGARQLRSYCHPDQFKPIAHLVYRNRGDGTFEDATEKAGWAKAEGKGLGIAFEDFDRDGRPDVVVANDSVAQQLFFNLGGGRFEERGLDSGMAYDDDGHSYGGMGIDAADYDNDGWPDVFINALAQQRYALYRNTKAMFEYASPSTNIAAITRMNSGWGTKFIDFDNDGWRDIFVAQGHVMDNIEQTQPSIKYMEPPLLMRNLRGKFERVPVSIPPLAARGAAFGDLDNDGWQDVVINCNNGAAVVLRSVPPAEGANRWLGVDVGGAFGAVVRVRTPDGRVQSAMASTASSYLASNDPRVYFGVGAAASALSVEVRFSDGATRTAENVPANQVIQILRK
jgi:hypothetical protein